MGMSRRQRIVMTSLWAGMVAVAVALLAAWAGAKFPSPVSDAQASEPLQPVGYPVPEFSLTNQAGATVTRETLAGKPWIAAFIYTRCIGPCPITTAKMKQLQPDLPAGVRMVSFTLDPEYDTSAVLTDYASKFEANTASWDFVTGPRDAILKAASAMRIGTKMGVGDAQIEHSTFLVLVGSNNKVVGYYKPTDSASMHQLALDARRLLADSGASANP